MLTKASIVTLARIALIPVFMWAMLSDMSFTNTLALIIFIVASVTDLVDGYLARHFNEVTTFGKFIDPLADKLLITSAMLIFVQQGRLASWAAMLIIAREFIITSLRLVAVAQGKVLAADLSGKIKANVQMVCVIILLSPIETFEVWLTNSDFIITMIMTVVTLWSGVDYLVRHRNILYESRREG